MSDYDIIKFDHVNEGKLMSQFTKFESLCILVCFTYIDLIINRKDHLLTKKVVKNLRN